MVRARHPIEVGSTPYSILILTPFTDTETRINALATRRKLPIQVSTIDRVQGHEVDAVILATSRNRCVDLLQCKSRCNVATSRARDLLVVIAHEKVVLGTYVDTVTGRRQLYHWGNILMHAKLYNANDQQALTILYNVRTWTEPTDKVTRKAQQVNQVMLHARSAVSTLPALSVDLKLRTQFCRRLCLKRHHKFNQALHQNMFWHMLHCNFDDFRAAVQIFGEEYDHKRRNNRIYTLFGFRRDTVVTAEIQCFIKSLY